MSAILMLVVPEFASLQMILTAGVFLAVWRIDIAGRWPTVLAGFAFGIYLVHPAVMLVAFKLFGPEVDRSFAALFTFFGSWAVTWVLLRAPGLRRFV